MKRLLLLSLLWSTYAIEAHADLDLAHPFQNQNTLAWKSFCLPDQNLLDAGGCTPDCSSAALSNVCQQLFTASHIEDFSHIPRPYLPQSVFIFEVNQSVVLPTAVFNMQLASQPSTNDGYFCEFVNEDGTPAILYNTNGFYSPTIAMDSTCTPYGQGSACKSNNYANFFTQSNNSNRTTYWFVEPNRPLYFVCLAYTQTGPQATQLQSRTGCSGPNTNCVYYTLQ